MLKIKIILICFLFFYTTSCGVKASPKPPEEKGRAEDVKKSEEN